MKPYTIVKDIFTTLIFAGMMYLINCVEPLPAIISNIASGVITAKTALAILTAIFAVSWFLSRISSMSSMSMGTKYYSIRERIKRYLR